MTPEPYPGTSAHFKIQRAEIHLNELRRTVRSFLESNPYSVTSEDNIEGDFVLHRVFITHPHVGLFLIAADVIQCLRTALDQVVWSLARGNHPDPDWSQFPVLGDPPDSKERQKFNRQLSGIPDEAIQFIESLQPYNRPSGSPLSDCLLWQLHELNRIDKHRRISVRTMVTFASKNMFAQGYAAIEPWEIKQTDYGYDFIAKGIHKNLKPTLTPKVLFGEDYIGQISLTRIEDMHCFVANKVVPFRASFAQPKKPTS